MADKDQKTDQKIDLQNEEAIPASQQESIKKEGGELTRSMGVRQPDKSKPPKEK